MNQSQLYIRMDSNLNDRDEKLLKLLKSPDFNFVIEELELEKGLICIPDLLNIQNPVNSWVLRITSADINSKSNSKTFYSRVKGFLEQYPQGLVLVEGFYRFGTKNRVLIQNFFQYQLKNLLKQQNNQSLGVFIPTRNYKDSAFCLLSIARRKQLKDNPPILSRPKGKMPNISDAQLFFIEGLLNCGPKKAELLLNHFKSPNSIIDAILNKSKEIENIKGFGPEFIEQNQKMLKEIL